ncbi:ATP-dependent nuclease [Bacillus altitudinis]|uniref:ATP-dependent nuclease n=1 Tax=Bacillus altitudinis TaxID=293387 RepID=UPI0015F264CA|nr:AAA family ATPase [Bacillus altitudinis]
MTEILNLSMEITNIKSIKTANFEIPLENGVHAIVGGNGAGKSTLLLALAQTISSFYLTTLKPYDCKQDSRLVFKLGELQHEWFYDMVTKRWEPKRSKSEKGSQRITFPGLYEGSLFYGKRFNDSRIVDKLIEDGKISTDYIVDADEYIKENLSFILHGDHLHYKNLKRMRNKFIAKSFKLANTPYFMEIDNHLISQYKMSSGECLLISLLHFIYNSIVRRSIPIDQIKLILIDEIELALHPVAVSRLIDFLDEITQQYDKTSIILTTHAAEVIRKINPNNIYNIENYNGELNFINPCYPSYAIRNIYTADRYDYILLVEDVLAETIIEKIINDKNLRESKLIQIVPVGGWENVLKLQIDLLSKNLFGLGTELISILDGDVKEQVSKLDKYKDLKKLFLPIKSVEKYLYEILITNPNYKLKKVLNDKYFTIRSIDNILMDFNKKYPKHVEQLDKKLYFALRKDLINRKIDERTFVTNLCNDILENVDFSKFVDQLSTKVIQKSLVKR